MAAVTVLVPTYQQAAFLPRALGSLRAQEVTDWDAVVVDDGCSDRTADILAAHLADQRIRAVRWLENRGLGATLNAGLELVTSPVVAYLPSDDVWDADHLTALLDVLADPAVTLAWTGVRHHGERCSLGAPEGYPLQLVQVAHRRTSLRWPRRDELESDDLELLFWRHHRGGRIAATGKVTCEWTDHPAQRHKAIRESFDGGLNVFRTRYRVPAPLRLHSSDSGITDEVERYRRFRERTYPQKPDGLKILLVGELAFNPERVLALAERGHRLFGLWTPDGLGDSTVGPLPFGHVEDLPREGWGDAMRRLRPDVIYAQLNWRAVRFAHEVRHAARGVPFVWHFKEAPQRSIARGEWPFLVDLVTRADACLVATEEERTWFELALPGLIDPDRITVLDGDLPKREWLEATSSPKLSAEDGQPHTVVVGRPLGLDAESVLSLARCRVHTHFFGQVNAPGPKGAWRAWLQRARSEAPRYVHVHPAVGPDSWVREFSKYDAGWLHRFASRNRGDLRRATWDDLNSPARLPVLLAAGLPLLQQSNRGHAVAVERIVGETGAGVIYDGLDDLVERLYAELASRSAAAASWRMRHQFTFDAHADWLVALLARVAGRSGGGAGGEVEWRSRQFRPGSVRVRDVVR